MRSRVLGSSIGIVAFVAAAAVADVPQSAVASFDHNYRAYATLLRAHVEGRGVNYRKLKTNRAALDAVALDLGAIDKATQEGWTREQRLAFWINAYNVFTLRAVVDHYPIQGSWFSIYPRNSIRQIDGVWTRLKWRAAGAELTLDQIEHDILRPVFKQPLVHFALSCGSVSCPALAAEPYVADRLLTQLGDATRGYLASERGLRAGGDRLDVSSLFSWYADDFVAEYARVVPGTRSEQERAVLGVVVRFGPAAPSALARTPGVRLDYLDYDWSLNEARGATTD